MAIDAHPVTRWDLREGESLATGLDVVRLLGGGPSFEAYLAWDERRHTLVVAKVLRPHLVDDTSFVRSLEREAGALASLAHPVLPRLFEVRLDQPRPLIVLELLDGPRLSSVIRRYGLVLEQVLPLALELCSALHYLESEGWVHRDVKPSNVILSSPPRLVDLSIARRVVELRRSDATAGTDAYMAPEQCDPARLSLIGPPTDIWGLGVTLYEALSRRRPFREGDGATGLRRYPQLVEAPEPLPRDVPPTLAEAIASCLAPDAGRRPTAAELAERLEPLGAALPRPRLGRFRPTDR